MPTNVHVFVVLGVGIVVPAWYFYQVASRKKRWLRYKLKRTVVSLVAYSIAAIVLRQQGLSAVLDVSCAVFVGLGAHWLFVPDPKRNRRIPKSVRAQVIARDLHSKGLEWDNSQYHIDHIISFSKGGDNSVRNLKVVRKEKNLKKGNKMPGLREFVKKSSL